MLDDPAPSIRHTLAEVRARSTGAAAPPPRRPPSGPGAPWVVPVHVALDRESGHVGAVREDILLPLNGERKRE